MSYRIENDNRFPLGTVVYAKENLSLKLVVKSYYQRVYYCTIAEDPSRKELVYFDRELVPPAG